MFFTGGYITEKRLRTTGLEPGLITSCTWYVSHRRMVGNDEEDSSKEEGHCSSTVDGSVSNLVSLLDIIHQNHLVIQDSNSFVLLKSQSVKTPSAALLPHSYTMVDTNLMHLSAIIGHVSPRQLQGSQVVN